MHRCWQHDPTQRPSFEEIVLRLNELIIGQLLPDPLARQIWNESWKEDEEITWESFLERLGPYVGNPQIHVLWNTTDNTNFDRNNLYFLAKVLTHPEKATGERKPLLMSVEIKRWGDILGCFPGFAENPYDWICMMGSIVQAPWFHGDLSAENRSSDFKLTRSQFRLDSKPPGTYLVRFSSSPQSLTLSYTSPQQQANGRHQVLHQRIRHNGQAYVTPDQRMFTSWAELLKAVRLATHL